MKPAACFAVSLLLAAAAPGGIPADDARIESFLSRSRIVSDEPIGKGITGARKLVLEMDGQVRKAAFKTVNVQRTRLTRFENSPSELNFTDNYRYERAAYLLDRALGIHMTPVAVLRTIDGQRGAVVDWIEGAVNAAESVEAGEQVGDPVALNRQRHTMSVFDALVANADRHLGNQLITPEDSRLHLIDFSRSFRPSRKLRPEFLEVPVHIPESLLERLKALTLDDVGRAMDGLLSREQVRALFRRRDHLLEKIAGDRKRYGDALVIFQQEE